MPAHHPFGILNFGLCDLPFDLAQGGESFDFAQDREPVERLVEPFVICYLKFFNCQHPTPSVPLQHVVRKIPLRA
jgi:hypothetical protein